MQRLIRTHRAALSLVILGSILLVPGTFAVASTVIGTGQGYTLSLSDNGNVAVLELDPTEYQGTIDSNGLGRSDVQGLSNRIYSHLSDDFDFILFVNNESSGPPNVPYSGLHIGAQNDTAGIGGSFFDDTAAFGSAGTLQSTIHLVSTTTVLGGPSLHEIMHRWAVRLDEFDIAQPSGNSASHWGVSGVGGQLGGFEPGTITDLGGGTFDADGPRGTGFGTFANGGNGLDYGAFELYLMGLIDANEFRTLHGNNGDIELAVNPVITDSSNGIFTADRIDTVNIDDIIANNGARPPGQTSFRSLFVLLTDSSNPADEAAINAFDSDVAMFGLDGDDGSSRFNFWEATGGRATMEVGNLFSSVIAQPPVAADDTFNIPPGQAHNEAAPGVLANDSDANGDSITAVLVSSPTDDPNFVLNADGSFTYTPGATTTTDSFTYTASDGTDSSNVATVTINVSAAPNTAPVAADDSFGVTAGQVLNQAAPGVLGNDSDADGDTLTASIGTPPSSAQSFVLNPDGSFDYDPNPGFTGGDSFTYTASDGTDTSNVATVTINVTATPNTAPVAVDDSFTTTQGQAITINAPGVLTNDSDADGDTITAVLGASPPNAQSFTLNLDGSFTYDPNPGFTGNDSFTYTVSDGTDTSSTATVTITVTPVGNPLACLDQVIALVDAYQIFANSTVAQANSEILALQQAGDISGALARAATARTDLTQEAGVVSQDIMNLCAQCVSDLQAQGMDSLVPQVQTECMNQSDRVGTIQATAVSQLENVTLPPGSGRPSRAASQMRNRFLRAISQAEQTANQSTSRYGVRYEQIVLRHSRRGDTAAASAAQTMATQVIQRSTASRITRIQELSTRYQTQFAAEAGAQSLISQVLLAAANAVTDIQAAEAQALADIQAATL